MTAGFITCVHPFYELPAVIGRRQAAVAALEESGVEVILAEIPRDPQQAVEIATRLKDAAIDVAVLFFCTWVAETITLAIARELADVPMLLWALPFLDRDVPMPSPMSGLTASASNIRRMGKSFAYAIGAVNPETMNQVNSALKAGAVVAALRRARFGLVGDPCPGMLDVEADETVLAKSLGATVIHFELDSVPGAAAPDACAAKRLMALAGGSIEISEERLADNLRLYAAIKELTRANHLDGYCVRCWPELRDQHKITPCTAHALMAGEGIVSTCEVDLPALITTFVLHRLAETPAFNFDITGYLKEEGAIQFAHCGAAEPSLAEEPARVRLRSHMRTGTGATIEFAFKEGPVTLAKLLRPVDGRLRLFVAEGTAISPCEEIRGSVATVRPEPSAAAFMDKMIGEAVEHHIALVYGKWSRELRHFCDFTGVEYVPLTSD
jgi:L-fucose isomerase-like protein